MQYFESSAYPSGTTGTRFMIGKTSMVLKWIGSTNQFLGATTQNNHNGESGSFGSGNDLKFRKSNNVSDTMIFEDEVSNLQFSLYDIDRSQGVVVTAVNAAGTAQNITMTKVSGTIISISGSGTTTATATTTNTNAANNSTTGTVNISIAGPVKKVTLRYTKSSSGSTADTVFVSDITACVTNSDWATDYQSINTPEPGQPSWVTAGFNKSLYLVDVLNDTSMLLFTDNTLSASGLNTVAVDPYNMHIYYTDNIRNSTNKSIFRYDVRTGTKTTWVADVTTLGIQLFSFGLGSGGAAFYDGCLFLGVDMGNTGGAEPVTTYRIDIDPATGNALRASRVWAKPGYTGSTMLFDWSDFAINNGILYNFNFAVAAAPGTGVMHIDLNGQNVTAGYTTGSRNQVAMDYAGTVYHMTKDSFQTYNGAGGFGPYREYTGNAVGDTTLIDAGESFKFPYDYGRDTASYGMPFHLYRQSPNLRLGSSVSYAASSGTDQDVNDNDGVSTFPEITVANASYSLDVSLINTTGAPAVLYGFIDFNGDGDFDDPGERSDPVIIANGATSGTITWTGLTGGVVGPTMMRLRLAPTDAEARQPGGYASNGEAEDYGIGIGMSSLPVELIQFTGEKTDMGTVLLEWTTASEFNNDYFDVQRSTDVINWETIGQVDGHGNSHQLISYSFTDKNPKTGNNYYRLKQVDFDGKTDYSLVINVRFDGDASLKDMPVVKNKLELYPNPVVDAFWIRSENDFSEANQASVEVFNTYGDLVYASDLQGSLHQVDLTSQPAGMYLVRVGDQTLKVIKK